MESFEMFRSHMKEIKRCESKKVVMLYETCAGV